MRISDWSSDVCSSDLNEDAGLFEHRALAAVIVAAVLVADREDVEDGRSTVVGVGHGPARIVELDVDEAGRTARAVRTEIEGDAPALGCLGADREAAIGNVDGQRRHAVEARSEEHTSELQSLMRHSYAVFCLKKTKLSRDQHD